MTDLEVGPGDAVADALRRVLTGAGVAAGQGDAGAPAGERGDGVPADAGVGAGDEGADAVEGGQVGRGPGHAGKATRG